MSWQIAANIREMFVDLVATDGKKGFLSRTANRKDSLVSGFNEALNLMASDFDRSSTTLAISSDFEKVALRERWGATTALMATEGFENILELGDQTRTSIFGLQPQRETPLISHDLSFGVTERILSNGSIELGLDDKEIDFVLSKLGLNEIKSVAICLLHSDKNKTHEIQLARKLKEKGYFVSCSHQHQGNELVRFKKTVENSFVGPIFENFTEEFIKLGFVKKNIDLRAQAKYIFDTTDDHILVTCLEDRILVRFYRENKECAQHELKTSPLSLIALDETGMAHVGPANVGSEPGPIILGNGLDLTYFDTLAFTSKLNLSDCPRIKIDPSRVLRVLAPLAKRLRVTPESCAEMFNDLGASYIATEISLLIEANRFSTVDCKITFDGWLGNLMAEKIISKSAFRDFEVAPMGHWSPALALLRDLRFDSNLKFLERGTASYES